MDGVATTTIYGNVWSPSASLLHQKVKGAYLPNGDEGETTGYEGDNNDVDDDDANDFFVGKCVTWHSPVTIKYTK
jgi:hypothetical protein